MDKLQAALNLLDETRRVLTVGITFPGQPILNSLPKSYLTTNQSIDINLATQIKVLARLDSLDEILTKIKEADK